MSDTTRNSIAAMSEDTPQAVQLMIGYGPWVVIDPPLLSLRHELQYDQREFRILRHGVGSVSRRVDSSILDFRDRMACPIGFLDRVRAHLAERDIEIREVVDYRHVPMQLAPDASAINAMRGRDAAIARAAVESESLLGQILVRDRHVIHQIQMLLACFPRARVLVVAATRASCSRLARALEAALHIRVEVAGLGKVPDHIWITVSTYTYAHLYEPHVIVLADAREALAQGAREQLARGIWHPVRIFCFRRPSLRLSRADEIRLEMMCGPVLNPISPLRATVMVSLCRSRRFAPVHSAANALERKRTAIWHHGPRNDLLAELAAAYARRDLRILHSHGLMLDASQEMWLMAPSIIKCTVIVESTEHAIELHSRLPDWGLRTCLTLSILSAGNAIKPAGATGTIMTLKYADTHRTHADVVLRADGGYGPIPSCRGFPPFRGAVPAGRCMVIDVLDDSDPQGLWDTRSRLIAYQHAGWQVSLTDLLATAKARFQQPTPSRRKPRKQGPQRRSNPLCHLKVTRRRNSRKPLVSDAFAPRPYPHAIFESEHEDMNTTDTMHRTHDLKGGHT